MLSNKSALTLVLPLLASVTALPSPAQWNTRSSSLDGILVPYSLSSDARDPERCAGIKRNREGYQLGSSIGGGPANAAGPLGDNATFADLTIILSELGDQSKVADEDFARANITRARNLNGLKTLDDYTRLYDNEWLLSTRNRGPALGLLTNYTQDLLFSMERLSTNPYALQRLRPNDEIPFQVSLTIVTKLTGQTTSQLLKAGRLFYVDHRNQSDLPRTSLYSAACDAMFYISPVNGDFLPLAIRTNFGKNLIYTPADLHEDWLLAKMMFNVNDLAMVTFDHLARSHFTVEALNLAALRTFSAEHPLMGLLKRLLYASLGVRAIGYEALFKPGVVVDRFFGLSGAGALKFANTTYFNGYAGAVRANYFYTNLERRGLIGYSQGPKLKHFPFFEDASPIYEAIRSFTGSYCASYYNSSVAIAGDSELQAWMVEAKAAQVIDFPSASNLLSVSDLADLMAHIGHLVSIAHHTANTNELLSGSGVLPFHPSALYKPVPDSKGVTDLASYLPDVDQAILAIDVFARFARPLLAGTNRTLVHMFDSEELLERSNPTVRAANNAFMSIMRAQSKIVSGRRFGNDGLSQGMPFVWKALDPDVIPWSIEI